MTDIDTLRDDLARADRRLEEKDRAPMEHRVLDLEAWRQHREILRRHRDELHRALEEAVAREEADADLAWNGGDAA